MNKVFVLASVLVALITATSCSQQETTNHIEQPKTQLEVKDGWFYINGVKTSLMRLVMKFLHVLANIPTKTENTPPNALAMI